MEGHMSTGRQEMGTPFTNGPVVRQGMLETVYKFIDIKQESEVT